MVLPDKAILQQLIRQVEAYAFSTQSEQTEERLRKLVAAFCDDSQVKAFMQQMPAVRQALLTDVDALLQNDPAATGREEVIACYPGITAMLHYRTAHVLHTLGVPIVPRMITEIAHSCTGIDIHPGAQIGNYFAIDHGTGVVIGATTIIGNHVTLYQGVTLGAKNFKYDENGCPRDMPRHPIIEDNVTIYSNTTILGRVRIGHDTVIGGNCWVTHEVAPHSIVKQSPTFHGIG